MTPVSSEAAPMLFADDPSAPLGNGISYAVVALVSVAVGKLIALFDDRDKRRHEQRLTTLELEHKACHEDRARDAVRIVELQHAVDKIKAGVKRRHPNDHDSADHEPLSDDDDVPAPDR